MLINSPSFSKQNCKILVVIILPSAPPVLVEKHIYKNNNGKLTHVVFFTSRIKTLCKMTSKKPWDRVQYRK